METCEKLVGLSVGTVITFVISQSVISPVLNIAKESFESIGLASLFTATVFVLALSDILGIKLSESD